jgi:hypothetical protein
VALLVGASTVAVRTMARNGAAVERTAQDRAALSVIVNRMRQELTSAVTVTELTASAITFTTPDVTGAANNTLRYTRTGSQLTRQVNGGAAAVLLDPCDEFKLLADVQGTLAPAAPSEGPEVVVAEHLTYPLAGTFATSELTLTTTNRVAQTFVPSDGSASSFKVSRAKVMVRRTTTTAGNLIAEIRPVKSGTEDPSSTVLDRATLSLSSLGTTAAYADVPFTSPSTLVIGTEYTLVFSTDITTTYTRVTYDFASVAQPLDGTTYRRSTDGGSTWSPALATAGLYDVKFQLYGRYQTSDGSGARVVQTGRLKSLAVHIAATINGKLLVLDGGAVCLNQPDMAGFVANDLPLIKALP